MWMVERRRKENITTSELAEITLSPATTVLVACK